jgi:hypothetical protein
MFFSIDIPFKGSQSLAKMTSKFTAESMTPLKCFQNFHIFTIADFCHSGVNDSGVHVTA